MSDNESLCADRPMFVSEDALAKAAEVFVQAMGRGNAYYLSENLRSIVRQSDALRALDAALDKEVL